MPSDQAFIVVTAILDQTARPAAITLSHGDALERAAKATAARSIAGLDIVELPIPPKAFSALRESTGRSQDTVAVYDVFPLTPHLDGATRRIAGQFLAAEILWALEEQGLLKGVPLNLKLDVPPGWDKSPKAVHEKLVEAGALDLGEKAIEDFKAVKAAWDAA
ncbi:Hypothetical protein I5071_23590 [Sandaracinus amylolyticus]|nr:Hypothetical protein I5071_23590 [Sandaracinus amylolyticus]